VTDVLIPEPIVTLKVGMAKVGTVKVGQVMSGDTYADSPIELRSGQATVLWEKNVSLPAPGDTYADRVLALVADSAVIHFDSVLRVSVDSPLALDGGAALVNPKLWRNICSELDLSPSPASSLTLAAAGCTNLDLDPLVCLEG
jgi:hypothetical protein